MQINRVISRNRRVPGRATGYSFFVIKWPSCMLSERCPHSTTLDYTIRKFSQSLRLVPPTERDSVTAHVDAGIRTERGGVRRVTLASWVGTQPLPEFFRLVRLAWRLLPKEHDDQVRTVSDEINIA